MKITLDNRDLENVHIDTYQMFTGESAEDYERENMREDGREDWDTVDISYNHDAVVKDLAHASINYLTQELAHDDIVKSITYVSHGSPRFYNYTTDWYVADYEVNTPKLNDYIAAHYDDVLSKMTGYSEYEKEKDIPSELIAHAGLCHYLNSAISADDYNSVMWEKEMECYSENQVIETIV